MNKILTVIQSAGFYFPDSSGGTEVYVDGLIQELHQQGINCLVAAPQNGEFEREYVYNNTHVYRYPVSPDLDIDQIRGVKSPGGFELFAQWLSQQKAQIYHQHSWTTGCGIHHLRYAKSLGLKTVVTVHVPGNVCLRGTMLLNGNEPCNGEIQQRRCSSCWAKARGVPSQAADWLSRIPLAISDCAATFPVQSRLASVLATPALVRTHQNRLLEMAALSDRIVAVCQWLYDALLINGVPQEKLVLSRQGVTSEVPPGLNSSKRNDGILHIGFLGRWDPIKGIHILVEAIQRLPKRIPVKLTVHGLVQGEEGQRYRQQILQRAAGDSRIHFAEPLPRNDILPTLATFDLLAVPSQWLETGPIVVLEAQAVGTPILGSDLGGIAELVQHGMDGWLVPPGNVEAWSQMIAKLGTNPTLIAKLRSKRGCVRTTKQMASEMSNMYRKIIEDDDTPEP